MLIIVVWIPGMSWSKFSSIHLTVEGIPGKMSTWIFNNAGIRIRTRCLRSNNVPPRTQRWTFLWLFVYWSVEVSQRAFHLSLISCHRLNPVPFQLSLSRCSWFHLPIMSTAHSPTFPSLHLRHNSFSDLSVALLTSQLTLKPFRCFTNITVHSPTLLSFLLRHKLFT